MKIKLAKISNLEDIRRINKEALFRYSWSYNKKALKRSIQYGGYYIAEYLGRAVGAIKLCKHGKSLWINTIAVSSGHRGMGIGKSLIKFAIRRAKQSKKIRLRLTSNTFMKNDRFYLSQGFNVIESGSYYGNKWNVYHKDVE